MTQSDLILLAREVANEAEEKGFTHTAEAMRSVLNDMLKATSCATATDAILEK
jgi:hypothetical protein